MASLRSSSEMDRSSPAPSDSSSSATESEKSFSHTSDSGKARMQPWKKFVTVDKQNSVLHVKDELRLWGNHVNAHS